MSSKDLKMRFDSQFCRMNCQMFSWLLSSGDLTFPITLLGRADAVIE
jgi:hypothetical protein